MGTLAQFYREDLPECNKCPQQMECHMNALLLNGCTEPPEITTENDKIIIAPHFTVHPESKVSFYEEVYKLIYKHKLLELLNSADFVDLMKKIQNLEAEIKETLTASLFDIRSYFSIQAKDTILKKSKNNASQPISPTIPPSPKTQPTPKTLGNYEQRLQELYRRLQRSVTKSLKLIARERFKNCPLKTEEALTPDQPLVKLPNVKGTRSSIG